MKKILLLSSLLLLLVNSCKQHQADETRDVKIIINNASTHNVKLEFLDRSYCIPNGAAVFDDSVWAWESKGCKTSFYVDTIRLTFDDSIQITHWQFPDSSSNRQIKTSYVFEEQIDYIYVPKEHNIMNRAGSYKYSYIEPVNLVECVYVITDDDYQRALEEGVVKRMIPATR